MTILSEIEINDLSPVAQKAVRGELPAPIRAMAAKGILVGARPTDVLCVLAALSADADTSIASTAQQTLSQLPPQLLTTIPDSDLPGGVLGVLAPLVAHDIELIASMTRMPRVDERMLVPLAGKATEKIGEILAVNEELMLRFPTVIECLYMNKRVRMSTADRLLELAVRNGLELKIPAFAQAAQAIKDELVLEATEEPSFDDVLFQSVTEISEAVGETDEDIHEVDEDGEELVRDKFVPLFAQISQMTITQQIRVAQLGNASERALLVRSTNRLVATAAISSPRVTENDAAKFAASRNVIDDVLRVIARSREFTRSYQVKYNLVTNPRTPLTFSMRLLPHIREADLKALLKSKNIPASIQSVIRQQVSRKQPKKK